MPLLSGQQSKQRFQQIELRIDSPLRRAPRPGTRSKSLAVGFPERRARRKDAEYPDINLHRSSEMLEGFGCRQVRG
jgi:hypothetical protein